MNLLGYFKVTSKLAVVAALASPSVLAAGGYGSAGVSDGRVGQQTAQAGIWCPALDATIPEDLFRRMDCDDASTARSAVANNRITNRPRLLGIFGAHEPQGRQEISDDDAPVAPTDVVRVDDDGPAPVPTVDPTPDPKPTPVASGPVGKWDRLSEFGVTQENFDSQSTEFRQQIREFRRQENFDNNWASFEPK